MYLLFDFDGTIVDSFNCLVAQISLLSKKFNFKEIKQTEIADLKDMSAHAAMQYLNVPFYKIPVLIYYVRKYLHDEMQNLQPIDNIPMVLQKLYYANFTLGILTSNSISNVNFWLKLHKLHHFFKFIHSESIFLSKKYLLNKTIKKYKIDKSKTYYISDEVRDINAAKEVKMKSIAVTWGYNSEKSLLQSAPTFIARKPEDLLTICAEIK